MLTKTYIHIPKVGLKTERRIHSFGVCDWFSFLNSPPPINRMLLNRIREHLPKSISELKKRNIDYFASLLPPSEWWRLVTTFYNSVAALDIETTGGSVYSTEVTLVGVFADGRYYAFYDDFDPNAVAHFLSRFKILLTYNGRRFDIPCLVRNCGLSFLKNTVNVDLMFLCRRLGLTGGLKSVERRLGIERPDSVRDLDGYDAVLLYRRYREGDADSLELLLRYNRSDVENLFAIFERLYPLLCEGVMYGLQNRASLEAV